MKITTEEYQKVYGHFLIPLIDPSNNDNVHHISLNEFIELAGLNGARKVLDVYEKPDNVLAKVLEGDNG